MTRGVFVAPNLSTGGAQRQWATLIPRLREYRIEPHVLTLDGRGRFFDEIDSAGVPCMCLGRRGPIIASDALAYAGQFPADFVVARGVSAEVIGAFLGAVQRVPLILTEHTPVRVDATSRPLRPRQRALRRLVARRASSVIAVSACQIGALQESGFPRERIVVIANGVPAAPPATPKGRADATLPRADEELAALLVAAIRPEKRVEDFVSAVRSARARGAAIRGFVAGDGPERPRLQDIAGDDVVFLGDRADIPELMRSADVVCLTSEAEALPLTLLEASAAGRAMIATRVGGVEEVVAEGRTGLLVPVGDVDGFASALLRLASAPDELKRFGAEARRVHAERFTEAEMLAQYAEVFKRVVAEHPPKSRLASVKGAYRAAISRGPGYEPQPKGRRYAPADRSVRGYYVDLTAKTRSGDRAVFAADGTSLGRAPTARAQLALGWAERVSAGDETAREPFLAAADQLLGLAERHGGRLVWRYEFNFPKYGARAPWLSAMAQGQCASVFARAYALTPVARYAEAAVAAVEPLLAPDEREGIVSVTQEGSVLEEYPGTSGVLNGWIFSLWGLRDVGVDVGDRRAERLFESSSKALAARLSLYDTGWWSKYSLLEGDLAKPFYHRLHIVQLRVMAELVEEPAFATAAERWECFDTRLAASRAVAAKAKRVLGR